MQHYFTAGDRVTSSVHGPGRVISDERDRSDLVQQPPLDRVWVLLDASDNPTAFRGGDLELVVE